MPSPRAFTAIVPFHLSGNADERIAFMDELAASFPDREDLEVLWVGDRSPGLWLPPVARYATHTVLENEKGKMYAGSARNTGLSHATGRWIFFADNDDLIDKKILDAVLDAILEKEKSEPFIELWIGPGNSFVNGSHAKGTRHLHYNKTVRLAQTQNDPSRLALHYGPYCKIIAKTLIDKTRARFGPWRVGEDSVFSAAVALGTQQVAYYTTPFYSIREGHESLMSVVHDDTIKGVFAAHRDVQSMLKKAGKQHLVFGAEHYIVKYGLKNPKAVLREVPQTFREGALLSPAKKWAGMIAKRIAPWIIKKDSDR